MMKDYLATYDFNLPLKDAFGNGALSMSRRMLAGAAMGQGLDDAYYSAHELLEALRTRAADHDAGVEADASLGQDMIDHILAGEGDDYQRRLYYVVSELDLGEAIGDLAWLVAELKGRGLMAKVFRQAGVPLPPLPGYRGPVERIGCRPFGC